MAQNWHCCLKDLPHCIIVSMDDFDLTGLDAKSAKDFLVSVITTLSNTKAKRLELEKEMELWTSRIHLSIEKGRSDLQAEAEVRVRDLKFELEDIKAEEAVYSAGVRRMKTQLQTIEAMPQLSVDAERLLVELDLLGGERDELADAFKEEEANQELQKLKEQIRKEDNENEGK